MFSNKLDIAKLVLNHKNKFLYVADFKRYLTSAKINAPNTDLHKPEEIQHKWYDLWQKKLKEFNKQVRILMRSLINFIE